jgi:hypothetical protein
VLVWYEEHATFRSAGRRELQIKGWRKEKKVSLILPENPDWADLSLEWQEDPSWKLEPDARPNIKRRNVNP